MRVISALAIVLCALLLIACSSSGSGGPSSTPSPSPEPTSPATDCGLSAFTSSTRPASLSWTGWHVDYTKQSMIEESIGADAIVQGRVLKEVHVEALTGFNQLACVWVTDVLRGDIAVGSTVLVGWPAPPVFEEAFDNRIGYQDGANYLLFLGKYAEDAHQDYPLRAEYHTWLRDVYPLDLNGPGAAPSQHAIDDLIATLRPSPDISAAVTALLAAHHLEGFAGISAQTIEFPDFPDAPGTLAPPASSDFLWRATYTRIHDAVVAGGYDWAGVTSAPAFAVSTRVRRPDLAADPRTVEAGFVVRDGEIVAAFLIGQHDAWTLDQFDAAAVQEAAYPPEPRNRAPATVNLSDWFGLDSITAVRYKGGDARLADGLFDTLDSRQALANALDGSFETHPTAGDDVNLDYGCSSTNLVIELSSGWSAGLTYHSPTNRLYAPADGFFVDAPPQLATLLGIEPGSEGQCYVDPQKQQ